MSVHVSSCKDIFRPYIHTYYIDSNYEFFLATSTFYLPRIDVEHYDVKSLLSITQRLWYVFSNRRIDPLENSRSYIFYSWSYNIRSFRGSREKFFVLPEATMLIFILSDLIYYFNGKFLFLLYIFYYFNRENFYFIRFNLLFFSRENYLIYYFNRELFNLLF